MNLLENLREAEAQQEQHLAHIIGEWEAVELRGGILVEIYQLIESTNLGCSKK